VQENHLRWDSLGEFMALAESFRHLAESTGNTGAATLAETLDRATERLLRRTSPGSQGRPDRQSRQPCVPRVCVAKELAEQTGNPEIAASFTPVAQALETDLPTIEQDLIDVQGHGVDLGGYYRPDAAKTEAVMRPSERLKARLCWSLPRPADGQGCQRSSRSSAMAWPIAVILGTSTTSMDAPAEVVENPVNGAVMNRTS
jgi:isocitrate dehydrogenase